MTKQYIITEAEKTLLQKVVANAALAHFKADLPFIIEADKILKALPEMTGEPVAMVVGKDAQKSYAISTGLVVGTVLYTQAQPLQTQRFDEWQRSPHMTRFQKFIDKDYELKQQPITADDVTDEMWSTFSEIAAQSPADIMGEDKQWIAAAYNAVIKYRGDAK